VFHCLVLAGVADAQGGPPPLRRSSRAENGELMGPSSLSPLVLQSDVVTSSLNTPDPVTLTSSSATKTSDQRDVINNIDTTVSLDTSESLSDQTFQPISTERASRTSAPLKELEASPSIGKVGPPIVAEIKSPTKTLVINKVVTHARYISLYHAVFIFFRVILYVFNPTKNIVFIKKI